MHPATSIRRRVGTALAAAAVAAGALMAAPPAMAATAAAEPAPTAAASAHQWLTGYWHNFDNGSTTLPLSEIPQAYNLIAIAFADNLAGTPGGITFDVGIAGYTNAQFKADVAALQAEGRKVVLSVGGETGNVIVSNATEAQNFADTAWQLMQEWGFDGIDIDLEHGINAQYMGDALHRLAALAGDDFVLTMAPQTIDFQYTTAGYYQLALDVKDILTIINTQYYNSGSMLGADGKVYTQGTVDFLTALSAIQLEMGLRPDQVGIGVPAVPSAAGGGYQSTANVIAAVDCLETGSGCGSFQPDAAYGPIGGVMTWSINWDATNDYAFAAAIGERLASGPAAPPAPDPDPQPDPDPDPQPDPDPDPQPDPDPDPQPDPDPDPQPDPDPNPQPDPEPGDCSAAAWSPSAVYWGGDRASFGGVEYEALWWTQGEEPGAAAVWAAISSCDGDGGATPAPDPEPDPDPATCDAAAWSAGAVYTGGEVVSYQGAEYRAQWWTQGDAPGAEQWGPWALVAACG